MLVIREYGVFNQRRYSNPWVAIVDKNTAKINFNIKVGGYTGRYGAGEAGQLYITNPIESAVYAYGQKDFRGGNTEVNYIKYVNGEIITIDKAHLIEALQ